MQQDLNVDINQTLPVTCDECGGIHFDLTFSTLPLFLVSRSNTGTECQKRSEKSGKCSKNIANNKLDPLTGMYILQYQIRLSVLKICNTKCTFYNTKYDYLC